MKLNARHFPRVPFTFRDVKTVHTDVYAPISWHFANLNHKKILDSRKSNFSESRKTSLVVIPAQAEIQ